ncbi:MAG: hypothetical protein LBV23_10800 [Deltaproteobacteria bacterium]|nr:hypothetical protein [Deltaproteobacteria bacterium]
MKSGASAPNKDMTIVQIEGAMLALQRSLGDADFKILLKKMSDLSGKNDVVAQKKPNFSKKE